MFREVMIERADGSDTLTPLMANAATPIRYKNVFGKDLVSLITNAIKTDENGNESYDIDFVSELAFIMAMQAKAADGSISIEKVNDVAYICWLEQFESMALTVAAPEILNVYLGNTKTASSAKKNRGKRSVK